MAGVDALGLFVLGLLRVAKATIGLAPLIYELDAFALDELVSGVYDVLMDEFQDALTVHLLIKFVIDLLNDKETVLWSEKHLHDGGVTVENNVFELVN